MSRDASGERYRLLEPVREFAAEVPGHEQTVESARANFLSWLIVHTQPPDPVTGEWLDLIETEIDNIRGGLMLASRESARALCEVSLNVTSYWHVRGPLAEGAHGSKRVSSNATVRGFISGPASTGHMVSSPPGWVTTKRLLAATRKHLGSRAT